MALFRGLAESFQLIGQLNRECRLYFLGISLNSFTSGVFSVLFNLYILSLGISPEALGAILSAGPFAQVLGSIPVGFLMERIGYKKTILLVYGMAGVARLLQLVSPSVPLIAVASFAGGLAFSGDFVVRLPFLSSNIAPEQRAQVFSLNSIIMSIMMAAGSLLAGYAPSLFQAFGLSTSAAYQLLLVLAGLLALSSVGLFWRLHPTPPAEPAGKISLAPYLWGINRFTVQTGGISLFVGLSLGLTGPFMNIYFLYHLGASREYFGVVSALSIIPSLISTTTGPLLARKIGATRSATLLRGLVPFFCINLALTTAAWSGTISYWLINALNIAAQPLTFAFAMRAARPVDRAAVTAWLNATFWLGVAIAAPLAGGFIDQANYQAPLFIAGGSILVAALLNEFFFQRLETRLAREEAGGVR